jgi:hypothetical protein
MAIQQLVEFGSATRGGKKEQEYSKPVAALLRSPTHSE